jgi:hypothetical protein
MKLLFLERVILEALERGKREVLNIADDCDIQKIIIENTIKKFSKKELIIQDKDKFQLNLKNQKEFLNEIKKKKNIKEELNELMNYFLNLFINDGNNIKFALKKVWISRDDEKRIDFHLSQIDELLKSIEVSNLRLKTSYDKKIIMKKVMFWGHCDYKHLIKEALRN